MLLAAGVVLRGLVTVAYRPAFHFHGDSGTYTNLSYLPLEPHHNRALGYVLLLKALHWTETFFSVVAVQHLAGLLIALVSYALVVRRGGARWLACLAAAPVLLDSLQVTLEHYVLTETLFTFLLVGSVGLLLWPVVPGPAACAGSGLLLAYAWFTRPNALPVALLLLAYLVLRRVGWRRVAAFAIAFLVPYGAVLAWIGDKPSAYGSSWANRVLYGRTAMIADCAHLELTEAQQAVCPPEPLGQRSDRGDWYVWNGPAARMPPEEGAVLGRFARAVILQQPADYLAAVARDLIPVFVPGWPLSPGLACLDGQWGLPETIREVPDDTSCRPKLASGGFRAPYADPDQAPPPSALTRGLHGYSVVGRTSAVVATLALGLLIAALVRYRRGDRATVRDATLLALVGLTIAVPPVVLGMYDPRYGLPGLPFMCLAGALAGHHLMTAREATRHRPPAAELAGTPG